MPDAGFWTGRKIAGFFLFAVVLMGLWYGVGRLLEKDQVALELASPDRRLVARIWCSGRCAPSGPTILTISRADRDVGLRPIPPTPGSDVIFIPPQQEGDVPADDVVTGLRWAELGGTTLRWTGPRALALSHMCLTDENWQRLGPRRFNGVSVGLVSEPLASAFRGGIGLDASGRMRYLSEAIERCEQRGGA